MNGGGSSRQADGLGLWPSVLSKVLAPRAFEISARIMLLRLGTVKGSSKGHVPNKLKSLGFQKPSAAQPGRKHGLDSVSVLPALLPGPRQVTYLSKPWLLSTVESRIPKSVLSWVMCISEL